MAEQVFSWLLDKGASILSENKEEKSDILLKAIKDGDLNIVTLLVGVVSDMNKMKFEGESLLSLAAFSGHTSVVKLLVSKGADLEGIDDDGLTPLHVACREGHIGIVRFLVSEGGDINRQTFDGMTPLAMASKRGHVEVLKYLISKDAEVERSNKKGWPPLIWACIRGHLPAAKYLLHIGADANGTDKHGWTSLHFATRYDRLDVVKSLVSAGAGINWPDEDRTTPLHVACYHGRIQILKYLFSNGADIQQAEIDGKTSLHMASGKGHHNVVSYILQQQVDGLVNRPDKKGQTPLHVATCKGFTSIIDTLVDKGGDLNAQTNEGHTCLHLAAKLCGGPVKVEVTKILSKLMAETPKGSLRPAEALVKLLVRKGADLDIPDKATKVPLDYVSDKMGQLKIRQHLSDSDIPGDTQRSIDDYDRKDSKQVSKRSSGSTSSSDPAISYEALLQLANEIPNPYVQDLGVKLGFNPAEINRFENTNAMGAEITSKGTRAMLLSWYNATPMVDTISRLKGALDGAGLVKLAENLQR